ncbi:MAG: TRAP-type mannitol/chloroaromatic compound transport system permease small subunit [Gammaproteobacteria bacterium]|jgi:TRAP-type mannitol/chloroaromatic compound transport system permease small subunit
MNAIIRAVDRLNQFVGLSVAHLYLICVLITMYEVVMRYFFNAPTQWAFEVVMVVCATAWALSGGYISMRQSHIAITILHERSKGKVRYYLDMFILLVSIVAMFVFAYSLVQPMTHAINILERSGTSFNSPEPTILKTLLFVGAMLYGVQLIVNLAKLFIRGVDPVEHTSLSEN